VRCVAQESIAEFDDCVIEVLMLSGSGRLLARDSVKETNDWDPIKDTCGARPNKCRPSHRCRYSVYEATDLGRNALRSNVSHSRKAEWLATRERARRGARGSMPKATPPEARVAAKASQSLSASPA
jgi:hypothetical protein